MLQDHIDDYFDENPRLRQLLATHAEEVDSHPVSAEPLVEVRPPDGPREASASTQPRKRVGRFVDYLETEVRNRKLGRMGEELVLQHERARLAAAGRDDLVARIEWVSNTQGDGLGYDIHSFEIDGTDRFLEVKATKNGLEHPFIITANELAVSQELGDRYWLVRVFDMPDQPKFYVLRGSVDNHVALEPRQYAARFE